MSDSIHDGTQETRDEAISFLLSIRINRDLGSALNPRTRMTSEQARLRQAANRQSEDLVAYRAELETLPDTEIFSRARAMRELLQKKRNAEEEKFHFNKPAAIADVSYWSVYPLWTLDEGIALALNRDPRHVTWEVVKPYVSVSKVAKRFAELRDLATRTQTSGLLHPSNRPGVFLRWLERVRFEAPTNLRAAVEANGIVIMDWQDAFTSARAAAESQTTLAQELAARVAALNAERDELVQRSRQAPSRWPWGGYTTELLEKLAATADRFWKLYDPADPSTAPTNAQVIQWLVKQDVAERVAEIMAQILRADGLRPGPRK